jgi:hypothetical protein
VYGKPKINVRKNQREHLGKMGTARLNTSSRASLSAINWRQGFT